MSQQKIEASPEEAEPEQDSEVKGNESSAPPSSDTDPATIPPEELVEAEDVSEETDSKALLAAKKTISLPGDRKLSEDSSKSQQSEPRRSKRGSIFDEKLEPEKKQTVPEDSGGFKEALLDLFSNTAREGPGTGTALKPLRRPKLTLENTYRLDSSHPFSPSRVESSINFILNEMLHSYVYSSKQAGQKALEIAEKIRRNVFAFRFDRYKICVIVTIGPVNRQGFYSGFRCLWDAHRDKYAHATFRNSSAFVIAMCYGVYYE